MKTLASLFRGPIVYVPHSDWPGWAALLAAAGIFALSAVIGVLVGLGYGAFVPSEVVEIGGTGQALPAMPFAVGFAAAQVCMILFAIAAAGFYGNERKQVLGLRRPSDGWRILPWALIPLFAGSTLLTTIVLYFWPDLLVNDMKPFQALIQSNAVWLILLVIAVGAPLSEELLFRGFMFSALSKTRLGFIGTALLTSFLWTSLHAGYSIFALVELLAMGLYFSWLLVRTGSVWVPIFCHAANNTLACLVLYFMTLPA